MSGYWSGWPRLFYELGVAAGGQLDLHLESNFPGVRRCGWRLGSFTLSCAAILWDDVPFFCAKRILKCLFSNVSEKALRIVA